MSWPAVARKDFRDALRSRTLLALTGLFALVIAATAYVVVEVTGGGRATPVQGVALLGVLLAMAAAVVFLVPLTGILVSKNAVVGERSSGAIRLTLSLPHTRRDVVLGKLVGRAAVLAVSVVVGFALSGAVLLLSVDGFPVAEYAAFVVATVLLGTAFVGLGVGISALTGSDTWATVLAATAFVGFGYLWNVLVGVVNGELGLLSGDALAFVHRFSVFTTFADALLALLSLTTDLSPTMGSLAVGGRAGAPFYLQVWFAFVIFAAWAVVPPLLGYLRFRRVDL